MADNEPDLEGGPALRTIAMPADTNPNGDIFGGWLLAQMDVAGGMAGARRARQGRHRRLEAMSFHRPVLIGGRGELLCRSCGSAGPPSRSRSRPGRCAAGERCRQGDAGRVHLCRDRRRQTLPAGPLGRRRLNGPIGAGAEVCYALRPRPFVISNDGHEESNDDAGTPAHGLRFASLRRPAEVDPAYNGAVSDAATGGTAEHDAGSRPGQRQGADRHRRRSSTRRR